MTTNEIMANLEAMSKNLDKNINALKVSKELIDDNFDGITIGSINTRLDDFISFKHWLDDLQEKHWEQEAQMEDATMFLHMIK